MPERYNLTEADRSAIARLIGASGQTGLEQTQYGPNNVPAASRVPKRLPVSERPFRSEPSRDIWVAQTIDGDPIPALTTENPSGTGTGTGTGTGEATYHPGCNLCCVNRIIPLGSSDWVL